MSSNWLLSRLARADARLLQPHLKAVDLPVRRQLEAGKKRVEDVYFLDTGLASVVANGGHPIEVGMIGREGMTGLSVVLDGDYRSIHETFMQIGGGGQRISAGKLREAIDASTTLHQVFLRFAHAFMIQATQTALANGRSKIEERLARWLLMANDRVDGDALILTHEFLATMLGVGRSGVTVALQQLERIAGRARWKIENETFNTLKNQGYHLEHNYGHGEKNLSVVLALVMMLAFLVDQVQQLCCPLFQAAWRKQGTKRQLWGEIRHHFRLLVFESMAELLMALVRGVTPQRPVFQDTS